MPLFTGEVTALEGEYREAKAPTLVIRGYDQGHRLMHGRRSAVFRQQKYSDIAQQMASQLGLEVGTIADSRTVFEYVHQAGQTAWEFLSDIADEVGFQVGVNDGKFNFAPPPAASGETCPIDRPDVPPEKRPSVTRAQVLPKPRPLRYVVG